MPDSRKQLLPFAAMSAAYFAHIGFFNPYLPLWLKEMGMGLLAISVLTSVQAATRLFAPYAWGALSDRTGERVKLLRLGAVVAFAFACLLWLDWGPVGLGLVLLVIFTHTSSMMPMSEAAMAHLVSQGGGFDAKRYGRVRLWGSLGFLVTVFVAGAWFEAFGMHHFPGWTVFSLGAVLLSAFWLPDLKETVHAEHVHLPVGPVLRQKQVLWFFAAAFFHVLSHIGIYVFFSQQNHDRRSLGGVGGGRDRVVFHPVALVAALAVDGLAGGLFCGHGAAHAADHGVGRCAVGFALGSSHSCADFCGAPHRLHCFAVAPFPGPLARAGSSFVHRDCLWLSGRARGLVGRYAQ